MAKEKETKAQEETAATEVVADTAQAKESAEATIETVTTPAKAKTGSKAATQKSKAAVETYIYVGPTLPDGSLRKNQTLRDTRDAVLAHLAAPLATYPQAKQLLVPLGSLAKEKRRIEAGDNAAAQAYGALSAATMNTQKEEN